MINIAICDDDNFYLEQLANMLQKASEELNVKFNIKQFNSGAEFESNVEKDLMYDLIFMDIELNEYNGVDIIRKLKVKNSYAIVIFVTNYDCYVSKVFRVGAFQYLKKPIEYDDLIIDLHRAIEKINNNKQTITLHINKEQKTINLSQIYYFEILCGETYACIDGKNVKLDKRVSLINLTNKLNDNFVKIHNSIIVNLNVVENITSESVILKNNIKCNFSRSFRKVFMYKYNSYLSGVKI